MLDPDLEMVGEVGGGGDGGRTLKNFFRSKNKGGKRAPWAPPLDSPLEGMHH